MSIFFLVIAWPTIVYFRYNSLSYLRESVLNREKAKKVEDAEEAISAVIEIKDQLNKIRNQRSKEDSFVKDEGEYKLTYWGLGHTLKYCTFESPADKFAPAKKMIEDYKRDLVIFVLEQEEMRKRFLCNFVNCVNIENINRTLKRLKEDNKIVEIYETELKALNVAEKFVLESKKGELLDITELCLKLVEIDEECLNDHRDVNVNSKKGVIKSITRSFIKKVLNQEGNEPIKKFVYCINIKSINKILEKFKRDVEKQSPSDDILIILNKLERADSELKEEDSWNIKEQTPKRIAIAAAFAPAVCFCSSYFSLVIKGR